MTLGNGLQKSYGQPPSMPKGYSKESADTLEAERNRHTSTRTSGTSARKAISTQNPTCATR